MSVSLQHKTTPVEAWHLAERVDPITDRAISAPEAIFTAIAELEPLGWRGAAAMSNGEWVIEFNSNADPAAPSVRPVIGEWVVLDIGLLRRFTSEEKAEHFDVSEEA